MRLPPSRSWEGPARQHPPPAATHERNTMTRGAMIREAGHMSSEDLEARRRHMEQVLKNDPRPLEQEKARDWIGVIDAVLADRGTPVAVEAESGGASSTEQTPD